MVWNPFKRRPVAGEGNTMAEANATTPPAGGIDYEKLGAAVAAGLAPALQSANKPLLDALARLQPAAPAEQGAAAKGGKGEAADKPLSMDDVRKAITDALSSTQQQQAKTQARASYAAEKLKDLPKVYQDQLPDTDDANALAQAEQRIRAAYQADFKLAGGKTADVGGQAAGGKPPTNAVDLSKVSPVQAIEMGLKAAKPAQGAAATTAGA
jgi:hypothetical protein